MNIGGESVEVEKISEIKQRLEKLLEEWNPQMKLDKKCSHNFQLLSPRDPIRKECIKCGMVRETNPYTGSEKVIKSKKAIEYYRNFFKTKLPSSFLSEY